MSFAKILLLAFLMPPLVSAKTFKNSYLALEIPDSWGCLRKGTAWICTSQNPIEAKQAVAIITAKVTAPNETPAYFENYLRQPKILNSKIGTPTPSKVMYVIKRQIEGVDWIIAQHLGSEIPNHYTLYIATVKEKIAVLVNLSADKNFYSKYQPAFDQVIKTLRIVADQKLLLALQPSIQQENEVLGINIQNRTGSEQKNSDEFSTAKQKMNFPLWLMIGAGLVLALAVINLLKSGRKKKH